ncbi:MAG: hypothetical protein K0Q46_4729 [Rhodococcus erythropolis]|jgi:hypothetical protein|nr:NYN domain-containing protein [Rhodococcus erythropolis]MDF2897943.1 hypothetical protein [Rhodococcus erythropolis]
MFSHEVAVLPLKRCLRGRRLVLIDIENVIGGAVLHEDAARWAKTQTLKVIGIGAADHIVIGTSHIGLLPVGCAWTNLRYVVGSGPDGADRALLSVLDEDVESRFDEIVLVSGDGIFTDKIAALAARGLRVTVIAHPGGLSKRLRLAAHLTFYLTDHYADGALGGAA